MLPEHVAYRQKSTCPERTLRKLDERSILPDVSLQFLKAAPRRFGVYAPAGTARRRRFRWLATSRSTVPRQANALLCRNSLGGACAQRPEGGLLRSSLSVRWFVCRVPTVFRQTRGKHGLQPTRCRLQKRRALAEKIARANGLQRLVQGVGERFGDACANSAGLVRKCLHKRVHALGWTRREGLPNFRCPGVLRRHELPQPVSVGNDIPSRMGQPFLSAQPRDDGL